MDLKKKYNFLYDWNSHPQQRELFGYFEVSYAKYLKSKDNRDIIIFLLNLKKYQLLSTLDQS